MRCFLFTETHWTEKLKVFDCRHRDWTRGGSVGCKDFHEWRVRSIVLNPVPLSSFVRWVGEILCHRETGLL